MVASFFLASLWLSAAEPTPPPATAPPLQPSVTLPLRMTGEAVAPFDLPLLDGGRLKDTDLRGVPTVLFFAATWCAVSKKVAPELELLRAARSQGARIVLVDVGEDSALVKRVWRDKKNVTMPIVLDEQSVLARAFAPEGKVDMMPSQIVVVDGMGRVRHFMLGRTPADVDVIVPAVKRTLDDLIPNKP